MGTIPKCYVMKICKLGQIHDCCRYLTVDEKGFGCEKHTMLKETIDRRVKSGMFTAKGDNCKGWTIEETVILIRR